MNILYNIAIFITGLLLKIIGLFHKKIDLFVKGRKETFNKLETNISITNKTIWFHSASLGEFEQGRPIIEKIKTQYPNYKIVLTFFSPSGYEVKKDYAFADVVTYLPLDSRANAKIFLDLVHPEMAIFIKYEFWPNILMELKTRNIQTILVSGIFRANQTFFKPYGGWMRKSLKSFDHFFVQNENSKKLIQKSGFNNVTISGDTRFDRVFEITKQDNTLASIEDFIQNNCILVAGSTWPKDEELLVDYINFHANENEKFIIAPHNINIKDIDRLKKSINKKVALYSTKENGKDVQVLIIDSIGILTKIYSYANVAYVGGGFGKDGVHNVLEPAAFGIPLIIGPEFNKFEEAIDLVNLDACEVVKNKGDLKNYLSRLYHDKPKRIKIGNITKEYILNHIGATKIILNYITNKI
jgi:3-deoxy-D-manno-octulosonic-acid transferase